MPKTRQEYWLPKFARNQARDTENEQALKRLGWGMLVVWECELADPDAALQKALHFLEGTSPAPTACPSLPAIVTRGQQTTSENSLLDPSRERRWLVLGEDGRHIWLGRATDPSEEEIVDAERALKSAGQAGWLAVSEGVYYGTGRLSLLRVRALADPTGSWDDAVSRFQTTRKAALKG